MNKYINYLIGFLLIITILTLFPDYPIPLPKEYLREVTGQVIICMFGIIIIFNELFREENSKQ